MFSIYVLAFCRAIVGIVFVVSFITKVRDVSRFSDTIANFQIVPRSISRPLGLAVLGSEFAVVVFIIVGGQLLTAAFTLAVFLLLSFSMALLYVLKRSIQTPCNCFGAADEPVSIYDVWRNMGFLIFASIGILLSSLSANVSGSLNAIEWTIIAIAVSVFVLAWMHLQEIWGLFST